MTHATVSIDDLAEITLAYHNRTKHKPERYAAGPETLDWDAQPNPFREFEGCTRRTLPLGAARHTTNFTDIYMPGRIPPAEFSIASAGVLLELSMGLSAWKEYGPDRWAVRCNPSSGNLHPTEAYLICRNVCGLDDGVYHYLSREHILEQRCCSTGSPGAHDLARGPAQLWIGLSSIHWREAWKYGERAFRYCQLDIGHALGAFRYAAGVLGWTVRLEENLSSSELAALMGLDRIEDFSGVEAEDPDLLLTIQPATKKVTSGDTNLTPSAFASETSQWTGHANLLDKRPIYHWPVINQVSLATRSDISSDTESVSQPYPPSFQCSGGPAAKIILNRRSAQRFNRQHRMNADIFYRMLDRLLNRPQAPWDVWTFSPRLHPVFFVHRIEGLEPGLYALPRHPKAAHALREALRPDFLWQKPGTTPGHIPFAHLAPVDCRGVARLVSCHQAIASDSCFSLSMLAEFDPIVGSNPWRYRQLHWEAGLLGHVLYLEAETAGLRGTGIGCYFDDLVHDLLGLKTTQFQSLYHFTVGYPLNDERILTQPPYPSERLLEGHPA